MGSYFTSTATFNLCVFKMSTNSCPIPLATKPVELSGVLRHNAATAAQPISAKAGILLKEKKTSKCIISVSVYDCFVFTAES